MRHFAYLTDDERSALFAVPPERVTPNSPRELLALALGATLYTPATKTHLDVHARRVASVGVTSNVWCLEDAIAHAAVPAAEQNVIATLHRIHAATGGAGDQNDKDDYPLLFVRVRNAEQIFRLAAGAGEALSVLTGFSLPKVSVANARILLQAIESVSESLDRPLYSMPILETPEIAFVEERRDALRNLAAIFDDHAERVLCVRVGGTDLSGIFGLRRDRDTTIWDVAVVRDALADILNIFARHGRYVVTGAVWEHIPGPRLFKPQLREAPFHKQHETNLRKQMIDDDVDALMREISLDKNNGMYGKTVIHPTHVTIVNSLLTVSRDEYDDALAVKASVHHGGVIASNYGRMNEMGPHAMWAEQICARAAVYGVLTDQSALVDLLAIGQHRVTEEYTAVASLQEAVGQ